MASREGWCTPNSQEMLKNLSPVKALSIRVRSNCIAQASESSCPTMSASVRTAATARGVSLGISCICYVYDMYIICAIHFFCIYNLNLFDIHCKCIVYVLHVTSIYVIHHCPSKESPWKNLMGLEDC
jgi:hypothetical protein